MTDFELSQSIENLLVERNPRGMKSVLNSSHASG